MQGRICRVGRVALAVLIVLWTCGAAAESFATGLTFGSRAVLEGLWSPAQLAGSATEKGVRKLAVPDYRPPARLTPKVEYAPLPAELRNSLRRVEPAGDEKVVALTFDLCERADDVTGYDGAIIDYLRTAKVPATFFAGGKWLRSHAERGMQLIADPLFEVGNHAWSHGNLRVLRGGRLRDQILWAQAQYELLREELAARAAAQGVAPRELAKIPPSMLSFRFPFGTCSAEALQVLAELGLPAIQWDVVSGDPARERSAAAMASDVLARAKPGSILIFHANGRGHGTSEALPRIVTELQKRGYRFVTVSELLRQGQAVSAEECYELQPGDNRQYDRLFGEGTG